MKWLGLVFVLSGPLALAEVPERKIIRDVRAYGAGCPAGTVSAAIAPDGSAFTLLMDNYKAEAGGNRMQDRKQCDIQIDLDVSEGWQFAIVAADYRGFVSIDKGARARHRVVYSFDGRRVGDEEGDEDGESASEDGLRYGFATTVFRGPVTDEYAIHHDVKIRRKPKSFCSQGGSRLFLTTFLIAKAPGHKADRNSTITLDSVDGSIQSQQFKLEWYRCDQFKTKRQ